MSGPAARYRRWYGRLLRFYPKSYRERFGEGMEQTFNDLLRERRDAGKGLLGFAVWMFVESCGGIVRESMTATAPVIKAFGHVIVSLVVAMAIIGSAYFSIGPENT
jgi:hypothetical protein